MKRKARGERVDRLRDDKDLGFDALAQPGGALGGRPPRPAARRRPHLPAMLNDRQADNWRMLVAIADLAGGDWGAARARRGGGAVDGRPDAARPAASCCSPDIRDYFDQTGKDRTPSMHLAVHLNALEGRPWPSTAAAARCRRTSSPTCSGRSGSRRARSDSTMPSRLNDRQGVHARRLRGGLEFVICRTRPLSNRNIVTSHGRCGFQRFPIRHMRLVVTDWNRPKATATATCDDVTDRHP